jgi:hypothetical protein
MLAVKTAHWQRLFCNAGARELNATKSPAGTECQSNNNKQERHPRSTCERALEWAHVMLPQESCCCCPSLPFCAWLQVIDAINALAKGKKDNTATAAEGALITDAGQLRKGTYTPDLAQM